MKDAPKFVSITSSDIRVHEHEFLKGDRLFAVDTSGAVWMLRPGFWDYEPGAGCFASPDVWVAPRWIKIEFEFQHNGDK